MRSCESEKWIRIRIFHSGKGAPKVDLLARTIEKPETQIVGSAP
jgi:hypothetical protein